MPFEFTRLNIVMEHETGEGKYRKIIVKLVFKN